MYVSWGALLCIYFFEISFTSLWCSYFQKQGAMAHSWVHCQRSYSCIGRISRLMIVTYLLSRWIYMVINKCLVGLLVFCFKLVVCAYKGTSSFMTSALDALVFVKVCVNTPRNTVNDFALMPRRPIHQKTSWRPRVVNYVELSNFAVSHLVELSLGWKYSSLWPPSLEFLVSHELPFLSVYAGGRSTMTTVRIQRCAKDIYINIWKLLLKSAFIKTIPLSLLRSTSHVWLYISKFLQRNNKLVSVIQHLQICNMSLSLTNTKLSFLVAFGCWNATLPFFNSIVAERTTYSIY